MNPGDLVFVHGSTVLSGGTPLILLETYRTQYTEYYVVLDPRTGDRYEYQEHDVSEFPR